MSVRGCNGATALSDLKATTEDVRYAYRLLLGREPDPDGYRVFCDRIAKGELGPADLAYLFFDSPEFVARNAELFQAGESIAPPAPVRPCRSEACTRRKLETSTYRYWARRLGDRPGMLHRKLWEWCYIAQALYERDMLQPTKRGLGFAVGREPLAALFASRGCAIVATDLGAEQAERTGWIESNQHASDIAHLNGRGLCPPESFAEHVTFQAADMRAIPESLRSFDFVWSSCAMEHLGGLAPGLEFVRRAMDCLAPGGIAVHTTEFNCDSDIETVETGHSVVYRKRDLKALAVALAADGHTLEPFDFDTGDSEADRIVDEPPYNGQVHLKLRIGRFASTSFGLVVRKAAIPVGSSE